MVVHRHLPSSLPSSSSILLLSCSSSSLPPSSALLVEPHHSILHPTNNHERVSVHRTPLLLIYSFLPSYLPRATPVNCLHSTIYHIQEERSCSLPLLVDTPPLTYSLAITILPPTPGYQHHTPVATRNLTAVHHVEDLVYGKFLDIEEQCTTVQYSTSRS